MLHSKLIGIRSTHPLGSLTLLSLI